MQSGKRTWKEPLRVLEIICSKPGQHILVMQAVTESIL